MSANPKTAASTRRKKSAQAQGRSDAALGHESQNMCSPEGAKGGGTLPVGWERKSVDEMVDEMQYGTSAKTSEDASGVPVLRMGNIKDGSLVLDSLKYLPAEHDEFPALLLQDGDLLFNRTNSAELVGKSAVYRGNPSQCSCASYLIRVRLRTGYVPEFLAYYINSTFGRAWVRSVVSQQVGQANVNGTKLKALAVPIPPLPEQLRIVAEIEKQFTRLEAGVAALKRVQANLKRYRAAVLKAACEGRLVPTERSKWNETTIGESVQIIDYRGRTPPFAESGIPHLRSQNIRHGRVVWNDLAYITKESYDAFMTRGLPKEGDLLFTTEAPMGEVTVAPVDKFSVAQRIMILRADPKSLDSRFLMAQLRSPQFQARLRRSGTGSTVTAGPSRTFGASRRSGVTCAPGCHDVYQLPCGCSDNGSRRACDGGEGAGRVG